MFDENPNSTLSSYTHVRVLDLAKFSLIFRTLLLKKTSGNYGHSIKKYKKLFKKIIGFISSFGAKL